MRLCVSCVYWTLLLVSVVSSGLLFLIVASESIQSFEKAKLLGHKENNPLKDVGKESSGGYCRALDNKVSDVCSRPTVKTEKEYLHPIERDKATSKSDDTGKKETDAENNLNVLKQSLTSQPNLSQGISETGQAVVLTLVETATAELQSLAEPRLASSETRSREARSSLKNVTLRTTSSGPIPEATIATTTSTTSSDLLQTSEQVTKSLESSEQASSSNLTKSSVTRSGDESNFSTRDASIEPTDDVVVVRAEQKILDESSIKKNEKIAEDEVELAPDESGKEETNFTGSIESEDPRANLPPGTIEDPAVIVDRLVIPSGPTEHQHEDIPSFSEWAQKRLEEAEKKKTHPNASIQNPGGGPGRGLGGMKVRSKNYASPDCGAKIVAVNPESRSARSVLVSTRDEYMLNTCTSRIWFVVELCEAIQAKKIELANFELFSSSPKEFSVHVSDRFPTREWSPVGQFTAKDQRDIQSFTLNPHLFGKFIKVELHSHYGSEHFCPISLFRAYGTSEFEVLETETDHQESEEDDSTSEDEEDEALDFESGTDTRNLFGSARDAVLRIVKKAAEVLVKTGDPANNITNIHESIEASIAGNSLTNCMTPRYTIYCPNCTDERFAGIFELLHCRNGHIEKILQIPFVNETLRRSQLCASYGFRPSLPKHTKTKNKSENPFSREPPRPSSPHLAFLASVYSPEYIIALCNLVTTKEGRFLVNTSYELSGNFSSNSSSPRLDIASPSFEILETSRRGRITTSGCISKNDGKDDACKSPMSRETRVTKIQEASEQDKSSTKTSTSTSSATSTATASTTTSSATTSTTTTTSTISSSESSEILTTRPETGSLASQIKPTKALVRDDIARRESSAAISEPSNTQKEDSQQAEVLTTPSPPINVPTISLKIIEEPLAVPGPIEATTPIAPKATTASANSASRESQESASGQETESPSSVESGEESKPTKPESGEQEAKLVPQDQLSLDSIFSELKDLEGDASGMQGASNQNANVAAQPTVSGSSTGSSSTPQQKESVFLRLSNRIKALERNMSLSGQYLEELSKRYKKQVEEMQRSLERATAAMSEESRKGEERELRRIEEISALREEITSLTESLEILLYDQNSWRSKLSTICQHFALVIIEIIVLMVVVSYCRRSSSELEEVVDRNGEQLGNDMEVARRRRSAGATTSTGVSKKSKKRRPSEIASRIGGSYGELMIDDRSSQETRKEKKKRRRRELNGKSNNGEGRTELRSFEDEDENENEDTLAPARRSSSTDPVSTHARQLELRQTRKRPDSAPEYSGIWIEPVIANRPTTLSEKRVPIEEITAPLTEERPDRSEREEKTSGVSIFRAGGILKVAKLSSPSFMKTALGSRSKRNSKTEKQESRSSSQQSEWYSGMNSGSNRSDSASPSSLHPELPMSNGQEDLIPKNGHHRSTESESSGSTSAPSSKKDKKTPRGLRKMVRKLF